jgi:histidine triad (HIT) family protein
MDSSFIVHPSLRSAAMALAMKAAYACQGIMLRQHNEPAGEQHIWHYHLHVIPRYENDQLHLSRKQPFAAHERAEYALQLRAKIKSFLTVQDKNVG